MTRCVSVVVTQVLLSNQKKSIPQKHLTVPRKKGGGGDWKKRLVRVSTRVCERVSTSESQSGSVVPKAHLKINGTSFLFNKPTIAQPLLSITQ